MGYSYFNCCLPHTTLRSRKEAKDARMNREIAARQRKADRAKAEREKAVSDGKT